MKAQEFIEKKLEKLRSTEKTEVSFNSDKDLTDYIFKKLMSKKFRKFSVNLEYIPQIHGVIENSIKNNLPIKLIFPFGAYKLWRLEETPEADWAELFTLMYYVKWLKPILEVYKPGILFDFSSDDVIVERINNIPKKDTEDYAKSLNMIFDFLKNYLPKNIKFSLTPVSSHYTTEEFEETLKEKISEMENQLGGLPVLNDHTRGMVELNVRLKPGQDKDPLWREKVELLHQAYYTLPKRRAYNNTKEKIKVFCIKMDNCIPVGTTKTSVAKFWPGVGVLKKKDDEFIEYVLSPSQLEKSEFIFEDISIEGLVGKNFNKIRII